MNGDLIYELMEARVKEVQKPHFQGMIQQDIMRRSANTYASGCPQFTRFDIHLGRRAGHTWAIQRFLHAHPDALCVVRNKDVMKRYAPKLLQSNQVWNEHKFASMIDLYGKFHGWLDNLGAPVDPAWVIYEHWMEGHGVRDSVKTYLDWHPSMRIQ